MKIALESTGASFCHSDCIKSAINDEIVALHLEVTKTDVNFLKLKSDVWLPNSQTGVFFSVDFDAGIECLILCMHASHHSDGIYTVTKQIKTVQKRDRNCIIDFSIFLKEGGGVRK